MIYFRRGTFRRNTRTNLTYGGQNYRGGYRRNYWHVNYKIGRSRSRKRQYSESTRRNDRSSSSRSRSGPRASTNRGRIRCQKCNEYDHTAKDCMTSKWEKETEQAQQMYNMDEEQTALKILVCYAIMKLTPIGLKQPLVTSQSQTRRLDMLSQHASIGQLSQHAVTLS